VMNIARAFTVSRMKRCCQIMGRQESRGLKWLDSARFHQITLHRLITYTCQVINPSGIYQIHNQNPSSIHIVTNCNVYR
jgi:hypothetical protein